MQYYTLLRRKVRSMEENGMSEIQIKITYKPLWEMLIEREMSRTDLRKKQKLRQVHLQR